MNNPVTNVNNKPINNDTATTDIINKYARLNETVITVRNLRREYDKYFWTMQAGNYPPFHITTNEARRRCLDGSLLEHAKAVTS